jgi:hypothetical protein
MLIVPGTFLFISPRVIRASRVFIDDWISAVAAPTSSGSTPLNLSVEQPEIAARVETFEDFMEAFPGLDSAAYHCQYHVLDPFYDALILWKQEEFLNLRNVRQARILVFPRWTNDTVRTPIWYQSLADQSVFIVFNTNALSQKNCVLLQFIDDSCSFYSNSLTVIVGSLL